MNINIRKVPALVLATALQVLPMCRVACVNQAVAPSGFAIVMRWMAGAVALLSSYHAYSGASAAIPGVYTVTAITNGVQTGAVTTSPTGTNGQLLIYKVLVTNPGNTQQGDIWSYDSLPPGLTMNTNVGGADGNGAGIITGVPTLPGVYKTGLKAWNVTTGPTLSATNLLTWTIYGGGGGATAPNITGPPVNQTVTAGANVSFTVTATGTAPLSYSWKFNGAPIANATTSSLQLNNVQTTNSGTYLVTVTNSAGSKSASATLTVNAAATGPSITGQPQSLTVTNGASASFTVIAGGTAPLTYQWLKGAAPVLNATNTTYTISAVTTNDAGSYSVVVSNSVSSLTSSAATLTVLVPPSIVTPPQSLTVSNGLNASFSVVAAGSAPLAYQWDFNGAPLPGATSSSLTITNVQPASQGNYTVVVSNAVNSITSTAAHLTVQTAAAGPFQLGNIQTGGGFLSFDITGPSQTNYVIWTSANLSVWSRLQTNFSTTGTIHFTDSNAPAQVRFYKATLSP